MKNRIKITPGGFHFLLFLSLVLVQSLFTGTTAYGLNFIYVDGSWGGPYNGTQAEPYKTIQGAGFLVDNITVIIVGLGAGENI